MDNPVTRSEMQDGIDRASVVSHDQLEDAKRHFDQRLKDSERILTWRMIATMGVGSVLTTLIGRVTLESEPVSQAVAAVGRIFS